MARINMYKHLSIETIYGIDKIIEEDADDTEDI